MKKIKILGALTHFKLKKSSNGKEELFVGGVDLARVIQPLKHLPKDEFDVDIEYELVGPNQKFKNTEELAKHYDILYFSYMDSVQFYIELKVQGMKHGMKMVVDMDDNIWKVDPTHPYYKGDFAPGSERNFNRSAIILDADAVTATNSFLRYQIVENTKRPIKDIEIFPNCIDLSLYDYKKIPPKVKSDEFVIGYAGGTSHFPDINKPEFVKAMRTIMDKYPQARLKTTFYMPQLKAEFGNKYRYCLGRYNVYRFIDEVWPQLGSECDMFVAPLSWSPYSRSKSYIKYLEYSAAKIPSVMEKIDPYDEVLANHPERGLQASTTEDWVNHISYLIENPEARKNIGDKAYKYVKANHTIQKNIDKYANYFRNLTKPKK